MKIQVFVNTQARGITGCFQTTNQSELMLEPGLIPTTSLLDNQSGRFAIRLASLPVGDRARELGGAPSEIGRRPAAFPSLSGL